MSEATNMWFPLDSISRKKIEWLLSDGIEALDEWETNFLESLLYQNRALTWRQRARLDEIYENFVGM